MSNNKKEVLVPEGFKELLQDFTVATLRENPPDLYEFALEYFTIKKMERDQQQEIASDSTAAYTAANANDSSHQQQVSKESESEEEEEPELSTPIAPRGRRVGVAAESFDPEKENDNREKVIHPKTEEQKARLNQAVQNILLFRCLDEDQMKDVIDAMFEKKVEFGDKVIEQGQDGDNFYVIEKGLYDIYVKISGVDTKVGQYDNKGSFGELALMYNTPRAATIVAVTEGVVWAMDRETFRTIVLVKAFQKRLVYEQLLECVPMLKELNSYERMSVADALRTTVFEVDQKVISQGDEGKEMYFIEDGSVRIMVSRDGGPEQQVNTLKKGDYFGELALLTKHPRAASVYTNEKTKLALLDVESFERLLGPCLDIMQRSISDYEGQLKSIFGSCEALPELRK